MKKVLGYSLLVLSITLAGCGGGSDDDNVYEDKGIVYKLMPQNGDNNYLFYGNVNPKSLGSLNSVKVIDTKTPKSILIEENNISVINYPVASTTMEYNQSNNSYKNLYVNKLSYASGNKAYIVNMKKSDTKPVVIQNSSADNLDKFSYKSIDYLGTTQYLTALDVDKNQTVLITPDMDQMTSPVIFGDRKLLTVTYQSYGDKIDGYLVYDNSEKKVQKCSLDMSCNYLDIPNVGSRDFEGDIAGTTYSVFMVDDKDLYRVDKKSGLVEVVTLGDKKIASGHGTTDFQDDSFYFIGEDHNLYRVNMIDKSINKLTNESDERLERIRGFTNNWVIYGSDTILMAVKKDGTSTKPVLLAQTTKTKGYKYVKDFGIGDEYLFVTYSVDTKSGDTRYRACIFNNGEIDCKANSFWAGVSASKSGELNFKSQYNYIPYAYIRVDDTDSFGGGVLKAIDPKHPFEDGITLGTIPNYNFQTFLSNSRYLTQNIDSDGGIILFAKNDTNFHVDAFYMNLLKENSLIQLTNDDPKDDIHKGRDHCHGRVCMICHNFAGGKIYKDLNGTKSAYGYRIRLDFEDGSNLLADISKGKGENFSMPIKKIKGNFKANVLDKDGNIVNSSVGFYHQGKEYINCNYCHARYGVTRFDAPGAISIK